MSILEAHDYFDLLTDKTGSPYLTGAEKDILITNACIEFVKRMLPSAENQGINFEVDETNYSNIYTLVYQTGTTSMSASGVVTVSAIQTLLNTASGTTDPLMGILGASWTKSGESYPIKYTRHNNWFTYLNNSFKKGSPTNPRYRFDKTNFTFYPIDTTASLSFTLLKQPKATSLSSGVDIELPSHCHKSIVELAVDLAATAIREPDLKALNEN